MKGKGFSLYFTDRETLNAIKWFFQNAKDCKSKGCRDQPFCLPCEEPLTIYVVSNGETLTRFLSSKPLASQLTTEYNFKHAKSGSSQNCKYIKITDRVKADGDSKQESFIHGFVLLVMQQTFTGSFIYERKHLLGAQASVGCQGYKRKEDINTALKGWSLVG